MSTSVTSVVSHFPSAENGFTTTLASTISSGATTVPLNSVAGYTNGETVVFVIDPAEPTKKQTFTGVIDTAGVQVTNVVWTAGTNQSHSGGATVVDYVTATHISMVSKGILVHADQDGTLKAGAVDVAAVLASDVVETAKIKDLNVTTAKLAANAVTPAKVGQAHSVRVTKSGNVSTDNNAVITWNTQEWRTTTAMHDTSTNSSRLIAPIDGYYQVNFTISSLNGETGSERIFHLRVNGTTKCVNWDSYNSSLFNYSSSSITVRLLANEYVEVFQVSGVSVTVRGSSSSFFDMTFLGGL